MRFTHPTWLLARAGSHRMRANPTRLLRLTFIAFQRQPELRGDLSRDYRALSSSTPADRPRLGGSGQLDDGILTLKRQHNADERIKRLRLPRGERPPSAHLGDPPRHQIDVNRRPPERGGDAREDREQVDEEADPPGRAAAVEREIKVTRREESDERQDDQKRRETPADPAMRGAVVVVEVDATRVAMERVVNVAAFIRQDWFDGVPSAGRECEAYNLGVYVRSPVGSASPQVSHAVALSHVGCVKRTCTAMCRRDGALRAPYDATAVSRSFRIRDSDRAWRGGRSRR